MKIKMGPKSFGICSLFLLVMAMSFGRAAANVDSIILFVLAVCTAALALHLAETGWTVIGYEFTPDGSPYEIQLGRFASLKEARAAKIGFLIGRDGAAADIYKLDSAGRYTQLVH